MSNSAKRPFNKPKTQSVQRSSAGRKRLSESEGDGLCVVCAHTIEIYAVGHCNHYICFKCSAKMRLLCEEKFCPVCRKELKKVIFTKKKDTFEHLNSLKLTKDKDYDVNIFFADLSIIKDYKKILEHKCPVCHDRPADLTFEKTKGHLRKEHTLFYCEICLEHNRTFTSECKVYSRKDLATHKRIGDPDDSSHRGHPLCEYCDERFLDNDKLFHHLRTTHYYCHICDNSESNEFYGTYVHLRVHFKESHFLCEIGGCAQEEFTSVFATELDFKAHCASAHKDNKSKHQQKVDRQIDLGFQYARRESPAPRRRDQGYGEERQQNGSRRSQRNKNSNYANAFERDDDFKQAIALSKQEAENNDRIKEKVSEKTHATTDIEAPKVSLFDQSTDFPGLTSTSAGEVSTPKASEEMIVTEKTKSSEKNLLLWNKNPTNLQSRLRNEEDFPSLLSAQTSPNIAIPPWGKTKVPKKKQSKNLQSTSALNSSRTVQAQTTNHSQNGDNLKSKKKFSKNMEDFPQLNPSNSVLVGRGSAKHFEGYESFSSTPSSNVRLIAADSVNANHGSVNKNQDSQFMQNFPSSNISVPPGFDVFRAESQFTKLTNYSHSPFELEDAQDDFPSLVSSNPGQQIRAPPGFHPLSNQRGKNSQVSSKKNPSYISQNTTLTDAKNSSAIRKNNNEVVGYSSSKNNTAGTTLTSYSISENVATPDSESNSDTFPNSNRTSSSTKKQAPFKVKDVEQEFPGLNVSSTPMYSSPQIDQRPSSKPKRNHKPSGTSLNLANVFDFPTL